MSSKLLTSLAAVTLVTACEQQTGETASPPKPDVGATTLAAGPPVETPVGATPAPPPPALRSSLEPEAMQLADWKNASLHGELGCGFRREGTDGPLLFAASDVDPAATSEAAIKLGGQVLKLGTANKGGFDALTTGARFAGPDGIVANVVRGTRRIRETPAIAEESPLYPAQLVVSQGERELGIDGFWECGP